MATFFTSNLVWAQIKVETYYYESSATCSADGISGINCSECATVNHPIGGSPNVVDITLTQRCSIPLASSTVSCPQPGGAVFRIPTPSSPSSLSNVLDCNHNHTADVGETFDGGELSGVEGDPLNPINDTAAATPPVAPSAQDIAGRTGDRIVPGARDSAPGTTGEEVPPVDIISGGPAPIAETADADDDDSSGAAAAAAAANPVARPSDELDDPAEDAPRRMGGGAPGETETHAEAASRARRDYITRENLNDPRVPLPEGQRDMSAEERNRANLGELEDSEITPRVVGNAAHELRTESCTSDMSSEERTGCHN